MFEDDSKRSNIIQTALGQAEKRGWRDLTLARIARKADVPLRVIHKEFGSKDAILRAFAEEVDREVLEKARAPDTDEPVRDRLFDVLMTRFEVLEPYKGALKRIHAETCCAPDASAFSLACTSMRSQYWMLTAAGIRGDGPFGALRVTGLAGAYASVMPVWLKEDDPDLPRTMAVLDRKLRRGEFWLSRLDSAACRAANIACRFVPRRREPEPDGRGDGGTRGGEQAAEAGV